MDTMLDRYRAILSERNTVRTDELFVDRLDRLHRGEEMAGREISGSYLPVVLELVESLEMLPRGLSIIDTIEAANVGLVDAIQSFEGSTAVEFWQHAQQTIMAWLNTIDDLQEIN